VALRFQVAAEVRRRTGLVVAVVRFLTSAATLRNLLDFSAVDSYPVYITTDPDVL
jgi:hypothetical protein